MKKTRKLTTDRKPQLEVKKEHVRPLSDEQLQDANGGWYPESWCKTCSCQC